MTEEEYRRYVALVRWDAQTHLDRLLIEWRRELWPDPSTDPISREDSRRRFRAELAAQAYWGIPHRTTYGGICVG